MHKKYTIHLTSVRVFLKIPGVTLLILVSSFTTFMQNKLIKLIFESMKRHIYSTDVRILNIITYIRINYQSSES
jgi:hypothetical protein